jgi:hypothetical protein
MLSFTTSVLASVDITESFNDFCTAVFYGRDIQLFESNMFTHKMIVEVSNVRMHALVQLSQSTNILIFVN